MTTHRTKTVYTAPAAETEASAPDFLCQSLVDGDLEMVSEEEWTL